jgi:Spy/CpxP family protein refolding chaperone
MSIALKLIKLGVITGIAVALVETSVIAQGTTAPTRRARPSVSTGRVTPGDVGGVTNLTNSQRRRIIAIREQNRRTIRDINANRRLTVQQRRQRTAAVLVREQRQINNVLTPRQRQDHQRWLASQRGTAGAGVGRGPGQTTAPAWLSSISDLTTRQKQQITEIQRETMRDMMNLRNQRNLTAAQRAERASEIRRVEQRKIMDVLNPSQKRQYENWLRTHRGA